MATGHNDLRIRYLDATWLMPMCQSNDQNIFFIIFMVLKLFHLTRLECVLYLIEINQLNVNFLGCFWVLLGWLLVT